MTWQELACGRLQRTVVGGWGRLYNKQLRQLRTCGQVAQLFARLALRSAQPWQALSNASSSRPATPRLVHSYDCHNKCKVLPSVGYTHKHTHVGRHTCIDYYLPLATWHLVFFYVFLFPFVELCTSFSRFSVTPSFFLVFFSTFGQLRKLPTHVEKFSLRFCDMKMLWIHSTRRTARAGGWLLACMGKLNLAARLAFFLPLVD